MEIVSVLLAVGALLFFFLYMLGGADQLADWWRGRKPQHYRWVDELLRRRR